MYYGTYILYPSNKPARDAGGKAHNEGITGRVSRREALQWLRLHQSSLGLEWGLPRLLASGFNVVRMLWPCSCRTINHRKGGVIMTYSAFNWTQGVFGYGCGIEGATEAVINATRKIGDEIHVFRGNENTAFISHRVTKYDGKTGESVSTVILPYKAPATVPEKVTA